MSKRESNYNIVVIRSNSHKVICDLITLILLLLSTYFII